MKLGAKSWHNAKNEKKTKTNIDLKIFLYASGTRSALLGNARVERVETQEWKEWEAGKVGTVTYMKLCQISQLLILPYSLFRNHALRSVGSLTRFLVCLLRTIIKSLLHLPYYTTTVSVRSQPTFTLLRSSTQYTSLSRFDWKKATHQMWAT